MLKYNYIIINRIAHLPGKLPNDDGQHHTWTSTLHLALVHPGSRYKINDIIDHMHAGCFAPHVDLTYAHEQ